MTYFKTQLATIFKRYPILPIGKDAYEPSTFALLQLQLDQIETLSLDQGFNQVCDTLKEHFAIHECMATMKKSGHAAHCVKWKFVT
jgi:hypothetical protein